MLECLIITIAIVYGYDVVRFVPELTSRIISRFTGLPVTAANVKLPKLLECSLCATFWSTLIILLIISPNLCWLSIFYSFATKYIYYTFQIVDKALSKLFIYLEKKL